MIEIRKDEYDRNIVLVPLSDYVAIKSYRIDEAPCYKDYDCKYFLFIEKFDEVERTVLSGELVDYISALEAEVERLKAKNVELRERLEKAVELPCKVGDTVYLLSQTSRCPAGEIVEAKIIDFIGWEDGYRFTAKGGGEWFSFLRGDIGTWVFTTCEAAEAKLAELKGEQNG